ncbi:MAG: AIR carboxylase family protein [Candidatus Woesearchaeota archaeon]
MNTRIVYAILGSTSDTETFRKAANTQKPEDLRIKVYYASVDNTPAKVSCVMEEICRQEGSPKAIMAGAGLANGLATAANNLKGLHDLVVALPFSDSVSRGLSSFLSTTEKPSKNPLPTVGPDEVAAAINIADKYVIGGQNGVIKLLHDSPSYRVDQKDMDQVADRMHKMRISYKQVPSEGIQPDDIVVSIFRDYDLADEEIGRHPTIGMVDKILNKGKGIQICVREKEAMEKWKEYLMLCSASRSSTCFVGIGKYDNAIMAACLLARQHEQYSKLIMEKNKHASDVANARSFIL